MNPRPLKLGIPFSRFPRYRFPRFRPGLTRRSKLWKFPRFPSFSKFPRFTTGLKTLYNYFSVSNLAVSLRLIVA